KDKSFIRGRGAVRIEHLDFGFEQTRGQLAGVGDGRRATNELRIAAIEMRDAAQPAKNVAQVASENSAVGVQLVEDNVTQIFEEPRPSRVVWQNSRVQHVRIGENDVALFADRFARVGRRVAVIRENAEAVLQALVQVVKFGELVLRESFRRKKIECAGIGIFENRVQNGQVVAERFSGSRGRDD